MAGLQMKEVPLQSKSFAWGHILLYQKRSLLSPTKQMAIVERITAIFIDAPAMI